MVDTIRTQIDLLNNLFQEGQPDGAITPQDMRDLIVSLTPSSAAGKFDTPAGITIETSGVFATPDSGTSSLINSTADIDMPQHGRIRYIGANDRHFIITLTLTATVAGNNQDCRFQLTKNGEALPETIMGRSWGTGSNSGSLAINTGLVLQQDDYIEIQAANDTSTGDILLENGVILLHGHIK